MATDSEQATDWEQEKRKALTEAEKKLSFRATRQLADYIDSEVGLVSDDDSLEAYKGTAKSLLKAAKLGTARSYFPSPRAPKNPPQERYQRPFKKRLYLVDFIIGRQLAIKRHRNRIRKPIKWEDTCRAWNEAHPNDPMTPKVLKATFYRAITDKVLQREYLKQKGMPERLEQHGVPIEGELELEGGFAGLLAWDRLMDFLTDLVGDGSLAVDWDFVLDMKGIPLDKHFPSPEVERMIRNDPYYARRVMNDFLVSLRPSYLWQHGRPIAYKPAYFDGVPKVKKQ